jgi:flagellar biosynthesis/type III secretory pathway ATPase
MTDPVADAVRSILDGHIVLSAGWRRQGTIRRSMSWRA